MSPSSPSAAGQRVGVLLAQLGTPAAPTATALRPYLREFLSDPRVVDLRPWKWWPILYGIVLTFRPRRSARLYQRIWTDEGSPLMLHSRAQESGLQERLGEGYRVVLGMRYGRPSIAQAMRQLEAEGIDRVLVFPMFPQFSCSTTGSIYDGVTRAAFGRRCPWFFDRRRWMPTLRIVPPYFDHPAYIDSLKARVQEEVAGLEGPPDRWPPVRPHSFRGGYYAFLAVTLADYQQHGRGRSAKWKTVAVPGGVFRQIARPVDPQGAE